MDNKTTSSSDLSLNGLVTRSNMEPTLHAIESGAFWSLLQTTGISRRRALLDWGAFVVRCRRALTEQSGPTQRIVKGQTYSRDIKLLGGGSYPVTWVIEDLLRLITRWNLGPVTIPARSLLPGVVVQDLDLHRLGGVNLEAPQKHPVIVVQYPLLAERWAVVDGNHRVFRAAEVNQTISMVWLNEQQMLEGLAFDAHRTYYAVHWNLSAWLNAEIDEQARIPGWMPLGMHDGTKPPRVQ